MYTGSWLRDVAPEALESLADAHEEIAQEIRAAAERQRCEAAQRDNAMRRIDSLLQLPDLVEARRQSMSLERAIQMVAEETGCPPETVARYVERREKELEAARRKARNIEIVRLAGRGWSNADIAGRFDLAPGSVSRILQRQLRAG